MWKNPTKRNVPFYSRERKIDACQQQQFAGVQRKQRGVGRVRMGAGARAKREGTDRAHVPAIRTDFRRSWWNGRTVVGLSVVRSSFSRDFIVASGHLSTSTTFSDGRRGPDLLRNCACMHELAAREHVLSTCFLPIERRLSLSLLRGLHLTE